jgi:hypothetical protein
VTRRTPALAAAAVAAAVLVGASLAGCGGPQPGSDPATGTTAPASSPTTTGTTDESACAGFGEAGVEDRLGEVYDDEAASQALVDEYAGAPRFQEGLEQTLELLRSSGGELEGDFLAQACGS